MENYNPYFWEWIQNIYKPTLIVYSTPNSDKSIRKNNLSPAEFVRAFTNFSGTNINFSFSDKFSINIKNFKLDTYDSIKFVKKNNNLIAEILENVLLSNQPDFNTKFIKDKKRSFLYNPSKREAFLKELKNYNYPWYDEFEKTYIETCFFHELELYQQPFGYVFIVSIHDRPDEIKKSRVKPMLFQEEIYETKMRSMVLVIYDRTISELSREEINSRYEAIKKQDSSFFTYFFEINTAKEDDIKQNDIWSNLIHKLDYYNPRNTTKDVIRGELISLDERETLKSAFFKFLNDFIKPYLQKLIIELDEQITSTKKGFKNTFVSMFKKSEKIEYINSLGIYKLTELEKKIYLLAIIQFYFRDYENAGDNLKILYTDLKNKSVEHYYTIYEFYYISMFLAGKHKELNLDQPYNNYFSMKLYNFSVRYIFIQIRMLEQLQRFVEIPKVALRMCNVENSVPYLHPLPFEKASYFYVIDDKNINHKKFCFFQYLAAITFNNQSIDLKRYMLNCFYLISDFFDKNDSSFMKAKEYLYSTIGDIAMSNYNYENASMFFANSIVLSLFKTQNEEQQALFLKSFLKSVKENESKIIISDSNDIKSKKRDDIVQSDKFLVKDIRIPEILNSTLITFEEQDVNLFRYKGWKAFKPFLNMDRGYINLSDSDYIALKNLDFLADNKLFKNEKKKFKSTANKKIYIKVIVKNPLNISLTISSMKLITQYADSQTLNENVICEDFSETLKPRSSNFVSLYVIPKAPGTLSILGLEICLFGIASFKNYFMDIDNREENNLYKDKIENKEAYKIIDYIILEEENDIQLVFLEKNHQTFQYQFSTVKAKIRNRSDKIVIKKFSIFFENEDIFISKYLHFDVLLNKNEEVYIDLPLCPQVYGKFKHKILVKFEDKEKYKEIEVKRYIFPVEIFPIVNSNIKESIVYSDNSLIKVKLNTKLNYSDNCNLLNISNNTNDTINNLTRKESDLPNNNDKRYYQVTNISDQKIIFNDYFLNSCKNNKENDIYYNEAETSKETRLNTDTTGETSSTDSINKREYYNYSDWENVAYSEKNQIIYYSDIFVNKPNDTYLKNNALSQKNLIPHDNKNSKKKGNMCFNSNYNDNNDSFKDKQISLLPWQIEELFKQNNNEFLNIFNNINNTNNSNIIEDENNKFTIKEIKTIDKLNEAFIIRFNKKTLLLTFNVTIKLTKNIDKAVSNSNVDLFEALSSNDNNANDNEKYITIKCGLFHNIKIKNQVNDKSFLLNSIKNNLSASFTTEKLENNETLIILNIRLKELFQALEVKEYEFNTKSDSDITWIGVKRKVIREVKRDIDTNEKKNSIDSIEHYIKFSCFTKLKGLVNLNKISLSLISKHNKDQPILLDYLPIPLTLEIN